MIKLKKLKVGESKVYALCEEYFQKYGAKGYDKEYIWYGFDWPAMQRIYRRNNIVPASILDCGAGTGQTVKDMRRSGFNAQGLEISAYAVKNAHPEAKPFLKHGDMRDIKKHFSAGSIDSIYANSLMYLTEAEIHEFLDDAYNIVNQSLYLVTPFKDYPDTIPVKDKWRKTLQTRAWWLDTLHDHGFDFCRGTNLLFKKRT